MATLTIRDVPPEVARAVKARAKRNGRSVQKELLAIVQSKVMDRAWAVAQIERAVASQKRSTTPEEIEEWIREGRQ